ncbi:MAG: prenyltransferase/squalene oxidase repeat-containing protein, partial [Candidatus Thorarchaeota archaeon]
MKQIKHVIVALIVTLMLIGSAPVTGDSQVATETPAGIFPQDQALTSATEGIPADVGEYLILQLPGQTTPARGASLNSLLTTSGIVSEVVNSLEIALITTCLRDAPLTIIDASVGSNQGANVSDEVVSLLIQYDRPIILLGEAGWLVHRLHGGGPPLITAPVTQTLTIPNTGAVYFSSPFTISNNSLLTAETLSLPVDTIQTEYSRLVNLSKAVTGLPVLRYDSYPLDTFILGMEDPDKWTQTGKDLLVNIIAYATALGESQTGIAVAATQSTGLLDGGLTYYHEPNLENTYYAVHSAYSILGTLEWATWRNEHQMLVTEVLDMSYVEYTTTAEFGSGIMDTAMGLWLVEVMELSAAFSVTKLVDYLSGEQTAGGFNDNIETTFHVTEALNESGALGSIDTSALTTWLIDCKILSSETSDPDKWSAIGKNPTSTDSRNSYANFYLRSLEFLGESHDDPVKLTHWILTRTAAGDGSFSNLLIAGIDPFTGTACALSSMEIMGTLESADRTAGLAWFASNQLPSGGFGLLDDGDDLAGKTEETSFVAMCLGYLSEQSGAIATGIETFVQGVETPVGFEGMDPLPSMMWGNWLSQVARLSHSTSMLDVEGLHQYFDYYEDLRPYPAWNNLTSYLASEYWLDQYGTKGVWSQYYGLEMLEYTGIPLSGFIGAEAENFLVLCQYTDGHFRPTTMFGTSHMQYTVAAVEALHKLDALGSIAERSTLDSVVMTEYSSGTWSSAGWTLEPFVGTQAAIDWLSTRTALRLGLVDSTMASEIISVIESRLQYNDMWALSRDIATLALLDQEFSVSYNSIDTQQVLDGLGATPFSNGWYNETGLWQPVFTAGVLEMLSILGLRTEVFDTIGNAVTMTVSGTPTSGHDLDLILSITSTDTFHTIYVNAFGSWIQFENVANIDTVTITVPSDYTYLGSETISVMIWDYGSSRSYDMDVVSVGGILQGDLVLDTPVALSGDKINGTVAWTLGSGGDAGATLVKVRIGDPPEYQEWIYPDEESPFSLSIPTTDFDPGVYNLTVSLNRNYCNELILTDTVEILSPDLTYIMSAGSLSTDTGVQVDIPWSLHFQTNGTYIAGEIVSLQILDESLQVVYSDTGISTSSPGHFYWTPDSRGNYTYLLDFERINTLEQSSYSSSLDVFEHTILVWTNPGIADQYSTIEFAVQFTTDSGMFLSGMDLHLTVTTPSMSTVIDTVLTTNSTGYATFTLLLSENGVYTLYAEFYENGLLHGSDSADAITSFSTSTVTTGGVDLEGLVGTEWTVWARLTDSLGLPVVGQEVNIQVIFLPSTAIIDTTLVTNSTGYVDLLWTATGPGSYSIVSEYLGVSSRGMGQDSIFTDLYVSTELIQNGSSPVLAVGSLCWMTYYALDHNSDPIPGIVVQFVIRDPSGALAYQTSRTTDSFGFVNFTFTLTARGLNNFTANNLRQTPYEASRLSATHGVYEQASVSIGLSEDALALHSNILVLTLVDTSLIGIEGDSLHTVITLDGDVILDVLNQTLIDGTITLSIYFETPGFLVITVTHAEQGWLLLVVEEWESNVLGDTEITIGTSGLPVDQGTTIGIEITLTDWEDIPLSGAIVTITVEWSNGTVISSVERTTGIDGVCAIAHEFSYIGDFMVRASYAGTLLNASANTLIVQRVTVT